MSSQQLHIQSKFQLQESHQQVGLQQQQQNEKLAEQKSQNQQLNEKQIEHQEYANQNDQDEKKQKHQQPCNKKQIDQNDIQSPGQNENWNKITEQQKQHNDNSSDKGQDQQREPHQQEIEIKVKQPKQEKIESPRKNLSHLKIRLESEQENAKNTIQLEQKCIKQNQQQLNQEEKIMMLALPQPPKNRDQQSFYYDQGSQKDKQINERIVHFEQYIVSNEDSIGILREDKIIDHQQNQCQKQIKKDSFSYQVLEPKQHQKAIVQGHQKEKCDNESEILSQRKRTLEQKSQSSKRQISNKDLLEKIKILEDTVAELKASKAQESKIQKQHQSYQQNQESLVQNQIEEKSQKKKKAIMSIHDKAVHDLVQDLTKAEGLNVNRVKRQTQKKYRRRIDLSALMEKDTKLQSNVFNLTVGEIIHRQTSQQKDILLDQIKRLRKRIEVLQQQNKSFISKQQKGDSAFNDKASKAQSRFSHSISPEKRKELCGKLIKKSEIMGGPRPEDFQCQQEKNETPKGFNFRGVKTAQNFFRTERNGQSSTIRQNNTEYEKALTSVRKSSISQKNSSFRLTSAKKNNSNSQLQSGRQSKKSEKNQTIQFNDQQKLDIPDTARTENIIQMIQKQGLQKPNLPNAPTPYDGQEDLLTIAKVSFAMFGVDFQQDTTIQIKKYKNCVHFSINIEKNIVWYFDTLKVYFGGWNIHLTGEGQKMGFGLEYFPDKYLFKGYFKQGKRNGIGMLKTIGGSRIVYIGDWKNGIKQGYGKQIEQSGIIYKGQWNQNKRHGKGQLIISQKQVYEGLFNKGLKNGYGLETFKNGDQYSGNYLNGKFNGKGLYQWSNGSSYNGQFSEGRRNGFGLWKASNNEKGDQYQGQYVMDKKHGKGIYRWSNGSEYQGSFVDDLKHGQGIIRYDNGKVANFLWQKGQPVKKLYSPQQSQYRMKNKSTQKGIKTGSQLNQKKYNLKYNSFEQTSKHNPENNSAGKNSIGNNDKYSVYRTMYKTRNLKPDSSINIEPITNQTLTEPAYQPMKTPFGGQRKAYS